MVVFRAHFWHDLIQRVWSGGGTLFERFWNETSPSWEFLSPRGPCIVSRYGFEFKRIAPPQITRSMHSALSDLQLTRLDIVHAGKQTFPLAKKVRAVAASEITKIYR